MLKKLLLLALLALCLPGCKTIMGELPSVQNCQHVEYKRDLSKVNATMQCDLSKDGLTGK